MAETVITAQMLYGETEDNPVERGLPGTIYEIAPGIQVVMSPVTIAAVKEFDRIQVGVVRQLRKLRKEFEDNEKILKQVEEGEEVEEAVLRGMSDGLLSFSDPDDEEHYRVAVTLRTAQAIARPMNGVEIDWSTPYLDMLVVERLVEDFTALRNRLSARL